MKKNIFNLLLPAAVLAFAVNACGIQSLDDANSQNLSQSSQNEAEISADQRAAHPFLKTVGSPIDGGKGKRWISNYKKSNPTGRRDYVIKAEELKRILTNAKCNGISLNYAVDANNTLHIIPIGVDDTGNEIHSNALMTENGEVTWEQGKNMIQKHEGRVRSHFFGANTFARLFKSGNCKEIRITFAADDAGSPQLLLTDASDIEPSSYQDESRPCPPFCLE